MGSSQSNSSTTSAVPAREVERMLRTPGTTPTASSIGRVKKRSTESGEASGQSARTVRLG